VEKYGKGRHATNDNKTWRMRFSCWISNATDTHLEYVILIASPRQKMVAQKRLSVTLYYIACRDRTPWKSDGVRQGGRAGRKQRLIIHSLKMLLNLAIGLLAVWTVARCCSKNACFFSLLLKFSINVNKVCSLCCV
jgi:hypothetical protein